jgi:hypothetical protein
LGVVLAVENFASRNSDAALGNSVAAFGREDVVHASTDEPYLGS